ncbi:MAG: BtpA/SgcQ family protein [Tagaea sp.]
MKPSHPIFANRPCVIGALHLPDLGVARATSVAWLEDYVLANARIFTEAGFPALMLQDQTRTPGTAETSTVALVSALGRLLRREFPAMRLGIIVQAHDAEAPLAIARATGADFVRLKVFVAAAMTAEGPRPALSASARTYRHAIHADGVAIFADVFDRTSIPMVDMPPERAAMWAQSMGADALVLTGSTFADSLDRIAKARAEGVKVPIVLGGSVTEANVGEALASADAAIVSTALMRKGAGEGDLVRWDADLARRLIERAHAAKGR